MQHWLLDVLTCPDCPGDRRLGVHATESEGDDILSGTLVCDGCGRHWPIAHGIPRFVERAQDYAGNFAFEWTRWGRVQIDRFAGHDLSETRFLKDTRWAPDWIRGKLILDAGCGAGRFSDVAAKHGARIVAVDLSRAVDACRDNMAVHGGRVQPVQASLYALPLRKEVFDAVFSVGVIQHTPDPEAVVRVLPAHLRPGGRLAYNWYEVTPFTRLQPIKYALRRVTPFLPHGAVYGLSLALTILFFPLTWTLRFIPKVRILNIAMPICAVHYPGLGLKQQFVWTLLDTFDWYSPRYEKRQRKQRIAELLTEEGLTAVQVEDGLGWATKPAA